MELQILMGQHLRHSKYILGDRRALVASAASIRHVVCVVVCGAVLVLCSITICKKKGPGFWQILPEFAAKFCET